MIDGDRAILSEVFMLQNLSNIFSELLNFYTENGMTEEQALKMIVGSLIFAGAVLLALYVLKAVAIFLMAKKCGLKNKWMSFVPYLNFVVLGKLAGHRSSRNNFMGRKII